jgi:hypothetical protein
MKILFIIITVCVSLTINGQNSISYDFDKDGKTDKFEIINKDSVFFISYLLTSEPKIIHFSKSIGLTGMNSMLQLQNNVVTLTNSFMRSVNYFKFRYDLQSRKFKLIGYENEQFGNAVHNGAGLSSYNLLTGKYVANWNYYNERKNKLFSTPTIRKKIPTKIYTISQFGDDVINELYDLDYKYLPKELR